MVFWSYFQDFVRAQKIEDLTESIFFFAVAFQKKSRFVSAEKKNGGRCTLSLFNRHAMQLLNLQSAWEIAHKYCKGHGKAVDHSDQVKRTRH